MAWCRHLRQLLLGGHRLEDLDLRNYALPARLLLPPLGLLVLFATEAQALSPRSPPIRRGEIPSPARLAGTSLENSGKVSLLHVYEHDILKKIMLTNHHKRRACRTMVRTSASRSRQRSTSKQLLFLEWFPLIKLLAGGTSSTVPNHGRLRGRC